VKPEGLDVEAGYVEKPQFIAALRHLRRVPHRAQGLRARVDEAAFVESGENLFLQDGRWIADYKPLAMAIQPFLLGRSASGDGPSQVHIDLDHPRVSNNEDGVLLFDSSGRPTPFVEQIGEMLSELDAGYRASEGFFAALDRYDLLEPFALDVELEDGSKHRMVGYHLINEERLRTLEPDAIAELHSDGHLMPIFMALASLSNLPKLIALKSRGDRNG